MIIPRLHASFKASVISGRCGALPAPKVSKTTPRTGGIQKALSVVPEIPGNKRSVALAENELQESLQVRVHIPTLGLIAWRSLQMILSKKTIATYFDEL